MSEDAHRSDLEGLRTEFDEKLRKQWRHFLGGALATGVAVTGILVTIALAEKTGEDGRDGKDATAPVGAVMAFASTCPEKEGWKPYPDAGGRFILGVGKGPLEKFVGLGTPGGKEKVTLTVEEMPEHNHEIGGNLTGFNYEGDPGKLKSSLIAVRDDGSAFRTEFQTPEGPEAGEKLLGHTDDGPDLKGQSHNNMPPYIALYFCKKVAP